MRRLGPTLLAIAAIVGGCGEGTSTDRTRAVRFQVAGEPEELAVYDRLVAAFEEDHPEIDVQLVGVAEKADHIARLVTAFAAGDAPDVFLVNFREFPPFVARRALEPAGPLLERRGVDIGEYYEPPIEAFTYQGALQCFPQNVSSLVVYVNLDLFEAAGLDVPAEWTWEEFRVAGERLTAGGVRGIGLEPQLIRVAPFVWSNGGDVVDDLASPNRFTLNEPSARTALEYLRDLVRDGVIPPEEEAVAEDAESRFANGRLGMYLSSRRATPVLRETRRLRFDVAPLPTAPGGEPSTILHSDAYCISATGDLASAAEFVAFAVGPQGQTITTVGGRTVPARISVAEGPFLDPGQPPARAQVFLDSIDVMRRTPVLSTWPEIEDAADEALKRWFYDDVDLDDLLADLDAQVRPLFAEGS